MKVLLLLAGLLLSVPFSVFAEESIPSFNAQITVYDTATIEVVETIVYDFDTTDRHGIFRRIPYSYQAGTETYTAPVTMVTVTDLAGNPRPFTESREGGILILKIGDPNQTVRGEHTYVISYSVEAPFLYFEDFDELYWNVTGNWAVPISEVTAFVNLPEGARALDASCYQGREGSTNACDEASKLQNANRAGFYAAGRNLSENHGLTVSVSFPKGAIAVVEHSYAPSRTTPHWLFLLSLLIPIITLIALLRMWYLRGRDPKGRSSIVPEYAPPEGLPPSIAGIVYNERIEPREISAEIIRLAVLGYLRIHHFETKVLFVTVDDYLFERVEGSKEPPDALGALILAKLFADDYKGTATIDGKVIEGVLLSKMRHAFVSARDEITDAMYSEVLTRGYFIERPDKVRARYTVTGAVTAVLGIFSIFVLPTLGFVLGGSLIATGIMLVSFGMAMPARTHEGVRIKEHLEGFKRYLSVAEKDRLAFHNAPRQGEDAPARTPAQFDAYLPYAMAFGVERAWAAQFADIYTTPPTWYTGMSGAAFSPGALTENLGAFSTDFSAASAPQSSGSGGGGSVGGGFGGGGGGSW